LVEYDLLRKGEKVKKVVSRYAKCAQVMRSLGKRWGVLLMIMIDRIKVTKRI